MTARVTLRVETLAEDQAALEDMLRRGDHPAWRKTLKQIGMLLVGSAQKAFDSQRLGTDAWEPRYPNQIGEPKANIAGIVSDLGRGVNPPERRFQDRPAGKDTGALRQSLTVERSVKVRSHEVAVSSDRPYSKRFQEGGKSSLPIDDRVREGVAEILDERPEMGDRLGWILGTKGTSILETESVPRPFLGVTPETTRKIMATVGHNLEGRPWEA